MNDLRNFRDGILRGGATNVLARIDAAAGDGSGDFYCILLDTGYRIRASIGIPGLAVAPLQVVILTRTDPSRRSLGTGYAITGLPPAALRGASLSAPSAGTFSLNRPAVVYLSPTALTIARGQTKTVIAYGAALDFADFEYGNKTSSFGLTNNPAPTVTPTQVTLSIAADAAMVIGVYDLLLSLLIAGVVGATLLTFRGFFTVTA